MIMLFFAVLGLASFMVVIYVPVTQPVMLIFLFLSGLAAGSYVLAFDCVKHVVHESVQGMAMGLTNMVIMLIGAPLFQPLIGWLLDVIGYSDNSYICVANRLESYRLALLPIIIALGLALLLALFVKPEKCK
jgi:MFS family permease